MPLDSLVAERDHEREHEYDLQLLESHTCQDSCEGCPFRGPKVGSKGNPRAPVVFVAESPGYVEVHSGKPLSGPSGQIFHAFVPDDDNIYVLNALECSPPQKKKNEKTLNQAALACRQRLLQKVQMHPRRLIVAMGNPAVRSLTGNWGLKITQIRGRLIPSHLSELGILPVVHIAALMRGTGSFRQWKEDIQYAMELASGRPPRKHIPAEVQVVSPFIPQAGIDWLFKQMMWPLIDAKRVGSQPAELTGDIETTGFDHINDRILSLGVTPANDPQISYCFYPHHFSMLKKHLESPDIKWCWHNGKFDIKFFHQLGINARCDDDTMLLSYCLDETGGVHDLETVSQDVLDAPDYKYMIQPYLPNKKASYELVPKGILAEYQAIDTSNTAQIRPILRERVRRDPALEKLYTQTLLPASEMITWVEENGIQTDPERLEQNHDYYRDILRDVGAEIDTMLPQPINAGSPQQVSKALFTWLRMPDYNKGSTDKDTLKKLQEKTEHPIIGLILRHRTAVKMYGTYVKGIQNKVHLDGRIYASYLLHGTRTGRLSSKKPNMQNVPRDPQIRGTFIAAPGYELVEVDLSQAELRSLACLSGDPLLLDIYLNDGDLHTDLANFLFPGYSEREEAGRRGDVAMKILAKEQRTLCKNVNFGIVYGISKFGLQDQTKKSLQECARMLEGWYTRYHIAGSFIKKCRDCPANNRVITTVFGRKKRVGLVTRDNLGFLQREAANFPHQSIASDITLQAGIRTWRVLRDAGVRIVNLVHDSVVMEVPITPQNELRHEVIQMVSRDLEQVPRDWGLTRIPFKADAEYGHRWGSLKEYEGPEYGEAA